MARLEHPSGDAQRDHRRKQRNAFVERERLASCMNSTKWIEVLQLLEWRLHARMRYIDDPPGREPQGAYELIEIMGEDGWIEWLEFDPIRRVQRGGLLNPEVVGDETDRLLAALRQISAPTSIEDGWIRVWGYLRPGAEPNWVIPSRPPANS